MSGFNVKFRGVRGSFPVSDKDFLKYGGNTSCVEIDIDGRLIILDAGTGIVSIGDEVMEKHISSSVSPENRCPVKSLILISHIHQDHLLGLTFFKPLHLKSSQINIYGYGSPEESLSDSLKQLVFGKSFPLELGDIACGLKVQDINDDCAIIVDKDGISNLVKLSEAKPNDDDILITFYKSYVHPQDGVVIYKISYKGKSVVYATDKECYFGGDKKFVKFAKNCDLLIHDAQYTAEDYLNPYSPKQGFGHSTYDMAIEVMKQAKAKNLVFFHYDPSYDDAKLDGIKQYYVTNNKNVYMAYEGFEFKV